MWRRGNRAKTQPPQQSDAVLRPVDQPRRIGPFRRRRLGPRMPITPPFMASSSSWLCSTATTTTTNGRLIISAMRSWTRSVDAKQRTATFGGGQWNVLTRSKKSSSPRYCHHDKLHLPRRQFKRASFVHHMSPYPFCRLTFTDFSPF